MAWVRIDDTMPDHPKVLEVGPVAAWLHICAIAYANRHRTDGFVPEAKLTHLAPVRHPRKQAARLLAAGLWHKVAGPDGRIVGYAIHDYAEYQLTRDQIETREAEARTRREERAEAGKRGASSRWGGREQLGIPLGEPG